MATSWQSELALAQPAQVPREVQKPPFGGGFGLALICPLTPLVASGCYRQKFPDLSRKEAAAQWAQESAEVKQAMKDRPCMYVLAIFCARRPGLR